MIRGVTLGTTLALINMLLVALSFRECKNLGFLVGCCVLRKLLLVFL